MNQTQKSVPQVVAQPPAPFAPIPENFKPHVYPYVRSHIKAAAGVFSKHEAAETSTLDLKLTETAVQEFYGLEGQPAPSREDISFLVGKYGFAADHKVTQKEFKRLLKELAGFKKFDKDTIGRRRYKANPGPFPGQANYVDPYLTHNQSPHAVKLESVHPLPPSFVPSKYPLSRSAVHYSKDIFRNSHMNQYHHLYLPALEAAVKNVYAIDHQKTPTLDDIVHVLSRHEFAVNREMTNKEFRRLLKELAGAKEYQKGSFGFVRKRPHEE